MQTDDAMTDRMHLLSASLVRAAGDGGCVGLEHRERGPGTGSPSSSISPARTAGSGRFCMLWPPGCCGLLNRYIMRTTVPSSTNPVTIERLS